jgi:hypothetical protein
MKQLAIYLHLARAASYRLRPMVQVKLLLLAAIVAYQLRLLRICAACRTKMLELNRNHMMRRWPTIGDALDDPDFRHFLHQVERRYPLEKAEQMLEGLDIDAANERETYFTDEEYAASLLGVSVSSLEKYGPADELPG